jgi:Zn-finger nucleic acid-binding protein
MSDRQGIEIDYCPKCRGVWLDRGELDKIIERSGTAQGAPAAPSAQPQSLPPASQPYARPDFVDSDWGKRQGGYGHRRKSWLSDIFD